MKDGETIWHPDPSRAAGALTRFLRASMRGVLMAGEGTPGHSDLMVTPESIAPWIVRDVAARAICDFMNWPEDGPAFDDAIKLAERLGFKLLMENPAFILLHALKELLATCDSDDEAFRDSGKRLAGAAIEKASALLSPAGDRS